MGKRKNSKSNNNFINTNINLKDNSKFEIDYDKLAMAIVKAYQIAVTLSRKYYKRYYALSKAGTINPDKFRKWNYRVCEMRDKCQNGEISAL